MFKFISFSFNPSQVQFTPDIEKKFAEAVYKFQSLTGSIHTKVVDENLNEKEEFQSLTGSIHTRQK